MVSGPSGTEGEIEINSKGVGLGCRGLSGGAGCGARGTIIEYFVPWSFDCSKLNDLFNPFFFQNIKLKLK